MNENLRQEIIALIKTEVDNILNNVFGKTLVQIRNFFIKNIK